MKAVVKSFFLWSFSILLIGNLFLFSTEAFALEKPSTKTDLTAMTFNLRYMNNFDSSPHTWEERRSTVRQVIRMEQPDIFGTQEAVYQQVKDVDNDLPNYDWIGLGREGGDKGEFMAVYYDETRFTPLEYDHYWLSDTPDVVGSTSWGNTIPRMVTWVKFLDTKTDKPLYFVNTHFDHISTEAREKSAELITEKIEEFDPDVPIIVTGDFNAGPDSEPHRILTEQGPFVDTWAAAQTRINEHLGTFNGFDNPSGGGADNRIDWILSSEDVTTETTAIVDYQKNGQYPSDHYPVVADIHLP
ncbi:endonuclease/exonuclease/phosphatase family protein [Alteribacillus sp. YIM 98480]|uniref:endonuclease/exonuclease/phosphatase family protein n=1 Tax=Alteribacillus sp. YIM 98480 TaxID=2606599 RepID=UPI001E3768AE|nr:endonuclease/exonuclease/phosphatase family protein [Alteribacillus sp. YIM 98480]